MKENKEVKISYWAAHLTTVISVSLVLVIVGVIAMITTAAANETRRIREQLELNVILTDSVSDSSVRSLADEIRRQPYALTVKVVSADEALGEWTRETGEDLKELFGVNPLSAEISVKLNADYTSPKTVNEIAKRLSAQPEVAEVAAPDTETVAKMNDNIGTLSVILGGIAVIMLLISFVLINNTVHLSVYSRRFTIHTMQLVGATDGFIRRPFALNNLIAGLLAGLFATVLLAVGAMCAPWLGIPGVMDAVPWQIFAAIAGGLILLGALICWISALIATTRYLHKDYGELFK